MSTVFNDPTQTTSVQPTQEQVNLQISDLQNLLMIIDIASQRGAFKGPELSQVGQVFDRVNQFLTSVLPPPNAQQPANQVTDQPVPSQSTFTGTSTNTPVSPAGVSPFFPIGSNN